MIEIIFGLSALLTLSFSFFKIKSLENNLKDLDSHIQELKKRATEMPFQLKSKINSLMILERKNSSQPVSMVSYEKLGKSVPSFFQSDTIYSLAEDEGFGLTGTCEGNGDCGLCAIEILEGVENVNPKNDIEKEILEKLDYKDGIRLCCQTNITGNVKINFIQAQNQ
jgi:ferredoxin